MSPSGNGTPRDHLFISYASEDGAFAEWLALRLTAEGYKVWIDRFKLLGGESYPEDIDWAIKGRTFRLLALLSRNSIHKPNPRRERTLALNLQDSREEELVIPLNVDGLDPTELDWMTTDITFVPFSRSWATGLAQLLEKLDEVNAPKDPADGREIAASAYLPDDVLSDGPELLYANLLRFKQIPEVLACYRPRQRLSDDELNALANEWAFWVEPTRTGRRRYFCFTEPPEEIDGVGRFSWHLLHAEEWRETESFLGKYPDHILKPLLRRAILHHLRQKGLKPLSADNPTELYFPPGLVPNNFLTFRMPDGRPARRKVVGKRTFPGKGDKYRYHQAVTVDVLRNLEPRFLVKFRIRPYITDLDGERLNRRSSDARRTHLTKGWRNDQWVERHLGICAFMSDENGKIVIGEQDPVVVDGSLVDFEAPRGINEEAIPKGTRPIYSTAGEDEDDTAEAESEQPEDADVGQ